MGTALNGLGSHQVQLRKEAVLAQTCLSCLLHCPLACLACLACFHSPLDGNQQHTCSACLPPSICFAHSATCLPSAVGEHDAAIPVMPSFDIPSEFLTHAVLDTVVPHAPELDLKNAVRSALESGADDLPDVLSSIPQRRLLFFGRSKSAPLVTLSLTDL